MSSPERWYEASASLSTWMTFKQTHVQNVGRWTGDIAHPGTSLIVVLLSGIRLVSTTRVCIRCCSVQMGQQHVCDPLRSGVLHRNIR